MVIVYFIIAILSTAIGALTGMGGGVIMKPIMDAMADFPAPVIGVLSSVTIFFMATVSCLKQIGKKSSIKAINCIFLGVGSILGGIIGQWAFSALNNNAVSDSLVVLIQNLVLIILIAAIFVYLLFKKKIGSLHFEHFSVYSIVGALLGIISAFLGIGGGPINVAILMLVFSIDIKSATVYSIVSILFTQISKLTSIIVSSGLALFEFSVLPFMIVGGIAGALIGGMIKSRVSEKFVTVAFNAVQILVAGLCIYNIIAALI